MKLIVKVENQLFEVEVGDIHDRPIIAAVDGERFEVWPEDIQLVKPAAGAEPIVGLPTAQPVAGKTAPVAPALSTPSSSAKSVLAPLPGVIVTVDVKPGDTVDHGQELCTIEAMKMKNIIRAGRVGTIEAVHVALNQHVKHHDILLEFTD